MPHSELRYAVAQWDCSAACAFVQCEFLRVHAGWVGVRHSAAHRRRKVGRIHAEDLGELDVKRTKLHTPSCAALRTPEPPPSSS
jgi:hypothetical protein